KCFHAHISTSKLFITLSILSSSPEKTEETSGADEGRETSSGIEVEASDQSLSLTGDEGGMEESRGESRSGSGERRETDPESSEEQDSDSMDDTGRYSINDDNNGHDHSNSEDESRMEEEEEEEEEEDNENSRRRTQRKRTNNERDQDSSDEERALEDWVVSEVLDLPKPNWYAIPALREREIGSSSRFIYDACGARGFVQRFKLQYNLELHNGCVNTLHFNQRGNWLASGSDDLKVIIWDWAQKKPVLEFESGHKSNVFQVREMPHQTGPKNSLIARVNAIWVREMGAGMCKKKKTSLLRGKGTGRKVKVEKVTVCTFFYSTCKDDILNTIYMRSDMMLWKLVVTKEKDKKVGLYTIYVNPANTHQFAVGGRDQFVRIYDQRKINENENNGVLKKFCPHHLVNSDSKANITCLVYSHDGSELLASYNDEDIYLFNSSHSDGAEYIKRYKGHRNNATANKLFEFYLFQAFVASRSFILHVFNWKRSLRERFQFCGGCQKGPKVNCLEPHPHLPILATSGLDHDVKVWAPTAEMPTELNGLKEMIKKNKRDRDEDSIHHTDLFDSHMLWFLMHHLRQRRHRRRRHDPGAGGDRDSDESSSSSDTSDEDDDGPDRVQCMPS
uniref:DDB1 and CUL4 associated factor 8 n=1 Tax=Latimeria chalumnae TaxID=7897 RepID=H3AGZ1_LATCH